MCLLGQDIRSLLHVASVVKENKKNLPFGGPNSVVSERRLNTGMLITFAITEIAKKQLPQFPLPALQARALFLPASRTSPHLHDSN